MALEMIVAAPQSWVRDLNQKQKASEEGIRATVIATV
jgi:hypothetical protein